MVRKRAAMWAVILLTAAAMLGSAAAGAHKEHRQRRTRAVAFYWHDTLQNKTSPETNTAAEVAGPGGNLTGLGFGRLVVFNDTITAGPDRLSPVLGRAQGIYVYDRAQSSAFDAMLAFSAVFDSPALNGTLNFLGADLILKKSRDVSIVGGTGDFELARGVATLHTQSVAGATFVVHFNCKLAY